MNFGAPHSCRRELPLNSQRFLKFLSDLPMSPMRRNSCGQPGTSSSHTQSGGEHLYSVFDPRGGESSAETARQAATRAGFSQVEPHEVVLIRSKVWRPTLPGRGLKKANGGGGSQDPPPP